jgi:hypothetical protein
VIRDVVLNVFLPALIAGVIMAIAWRPWQRGERAVQRGTWASPLTFGIGYLFSFVVVSGGVDASLERWQWLGVLALAAGVAGLVLEVGRRPSLRMWLIVAAVATAAVWMIDLPRVDAWIWRIGLGFTILVTYGVLDMLVRRPARIGLPIVLMVVFSVASGLVFQANFLKLALTTGSLAAVSGVLMVTTLLNRHAELGRGGVMFIAAVLPTLLLTGYAYDYADIPPWVFALPLIGLLATSVSAVPVVARRPVWLRITVQVALALIPCAVGLAVLFGGAEDDSESDGADVYGEYAPY